LVQSLGSMLILGNNAGEREVGGNSLSTREFRRKLQQDMWKIKQLVLAWGAGWGAREEAFEIEGWAPSKKSESNLPRSLGGTTQNYKKIQESLKKRSLVRDLGNVYE
jgi:hypothetical protein